MVLAGGYLVLFIFILIDIAVSKPDPMLMLSLMFFTSPWSFWLMDALHGCALESYLAVGGPAMFFFLMFLCAFVNATILYLFGLLLTKIWSFLTKSEQ